MAPPAGFAAVSYHGHRSDQGRVWVLQPPFSLRTNDDVAQEDHAKASAECDIVYTNATALLAQAGYGSGSACAVFLWGQASIAHVIMEHCGALYHDRLGRPLDLRTVYRHLFSLMFAMAHGISLTTVAEEVALREESSIRTPAWLVTAEERSALNYAMENASDADDTHFAAVWHGSKLMRDVLRASDAVGASVFKVRAGGSGDIVFVMDDHHRALRSKRAREEGINQSVNKNKTTSFGFSMGVHAAAGRKNDAHRVRLVAEAAQACRRTSR